MRRPTFAGNTRTTRCLEPIGALSLTNFEVQHCASRRPRTMGETYDMLFTPKEPGAYVLQARAGPVNVLASQPIRVVRRP